MFCVSVGDERGGKRKQGVPVVGFARSPCSEYNVKTGQRWGTEPSGIWEKSTPGRGNSRCKGPKVGVCLVCCCGHSSPLNVTLSMLASAKLNIWNEGQCVSHLEIYHTIQQTILWSYSLSKTTFCLFIEFIYLFLEKGEGKGKGRRKKGRKTLMCERNIHWLPLCPQLGTWPTTQACALTENRTSNPSVRRPTLNPLSHTSQGIR